MTRRWLLAVPPAAYVAWLTFLHLAVVAGDRRDRAQGRTPRLARTVRDADDGRP